MPWRSRTASSYGSCQDKGIEATFEWKGRVDKPASKTKAEHWKVTSDNWEHCRNTAGVSDVNKCKFSNVFPYQYARITISVNRLHKENFLMGNLFLVALLRVYACLLFKNFTRSIFAVKL